MKGHFWETLDYFFSWGFYYGAIVGAYIGTGIYPLIGTLLGGFFGSAIGIVLGVISGLLAYKIHAEFFHSDMDLERYSDRFARLFGSAMGVSAFALLWGLVFLLVSGPGGRDEYVWRMILLSSPLVALLGALSAAYTASYYPAAILHRMIKRGRLAIAAETVPPVNDDAVQEALKALFRHPSMRWILVVVAVAGFFTAFGVFGAMVSLLVWLYLGFGNAMLITFLKRVVYTRHISVHRYRTSLTLISFVATWAMIWWMLLPGLAAGILMASVVYQTLAIPDETPEKEKRKEKNTLALEEEGEAEDEMLVAESRLIEAIQRR